jgi:hypothetical protein
VEDTVEVNEESATVPAECDIPEAMMKSVWEIEDFVTGLAQKCMKQMTLDLYLRTWVFRT